MQPTYVGVSKKHAHISFEGELLPKTNDCCNLECSSRYIIDCVE